MRAVIKRRGAAAAKVSEDDVLRAIEKLRVLGGGWSALRVGGRVVVRSGASRVARRFPFSSRRSPRVLSLHWSPYDPVREVHVDP
jgi:ESCRT-II complex subunit VPS22